MDAYQDGVNADRNASDYKKTTMQVTNHKTKAATCKRRRMGRQNPSIRLTANNS